MTTYHRCLYCSNCRITGLNHDAACAEAYELAKGAGLPVKAVQSEGRNALLIDISGEAGEFCEGFDLMSYAALAEEFGDEVAAAAHDQAFDPCAASGVQPGRDFPATM